MNPIDELVERFPHLRNLNQRRLSRFWPIPT